MCRIKIDIVFVNDSDNITVRLSGRSSPIIATVAAKDLDRQGNVSKVFLREKIISQTDSTSWEGWLPSGAVTTVLTRIAADS